MAFWKTRMLSRSQKIEARTFAVDFCSPNFLGRCEPAVITSTNILSTYLYITTKFASPNSSNATYPVTFIPIHVTAYLALGGVPKWRTTLSSHRHKIVLHDFVDGVTAPQPRDVEYRWLTFPLTSVCSFQIRSNTHFFYDHVERVRAVIRGNRRLTVREVANEVGISIGSCHQILTEKLHMRRISAKFVPRLLTGDQKENRVEISQELLANANGNENFLKNIITRWDMGLWVWCWN